MSAAMQNARHRDASHNAAMLSMVSLRALTFEIFGRLLCLVRPNEGEEIVLIAQRNGTAAN